MIEQALRWLLPAALIAALVCIALLVRAVRRRSGEDAHLRELHPDEPWLWRADLAVGAESLAPVVAAVPLLRRTFFFDDATAFPVPARVCFDLVAGFLPAVPALALLLVRAPVLDALRERAAWRWAAALRAW